MPGSFITKLLVSLVKRQAGRWENSFLQMTHEPQKVQQSLLQEILARQQATEFGQQLRFSGIHTLDDYRKNVPVHRYEDLDPWILKVRQGNVNALLSEKKIHMFALTSGTTATRKFIPVTPSYLNNYRRGTSIWGKRFFDAHPNGYLKPILQLVGDWDEFRSESGVPCGSVSGLTTHMQKKVVRWMFCLPALSGKIKNSQAKLYLAARLSLVHRELGMLSTANPSTMTQLAILMNDKKEQLIRDIYDGGIGTEAGIVPEIREVLKRALKKLPERAKELEKISHEKGTLYPKDAWRAIHAIGCWTGGSVGLYLKQFGKYYDPRWPIRDLGLIASEGRFTIPVEEQTSGGVLDITSHFFEFIPISEEPASNPKTLFAWELEEGKEYYLLPTTSYGLYRYHIYDVVKVIGFYHRTPVLVFLNKGASFSSLTGEKVSEHQVVEAIREAGQAHDFVPTAYTLAACWDDTQPYYSLFVEEHELMNIPRDAWLGTVEASLNRLNIEYESKRTSGRLGSMKLSTLRDGTWQIWDAERLRNTGGTAEQYKRPCLISDTEFNKRMNIYRV